MYNSDKTAERIKLLAKNRKISIKQLLESCDLNKNALSSMSVRGSWIQANSLAKIADYLDCSVDYLLGRVDIPNWEIKKAPPESGAEEYVQNINTDDISREDIKELVEWIKSQKSKDL